MSQVPTTSRSESFSIDELANSVVSGKMRIPEFQRGFRWNSRDVIDLFDSIRRGYPIGSALLWRREAEAAEVRIGDIRVTASAKPDALWVVDGQQRLTTLVNAVDPSVSKDSVFALSYLPAQDRFVRPREARAELSIPVPDLFDIPRLFSWLQSHPEAVEYADSLQKVTTILRDFKLPATIVSGADELELRRIFDRINNAGKRLTAAEVFDAINRTTSAEGQTMSLGGMSDSLASQTNFGKLPHTLVHKLLLVRRHPDITRSPHAEWEADRRASSDFPTESKQESFKATEEAIRNSIVFLQAEVGVPHFTFLPQQFLLFALTRFLAFFPTPEPRTKHLLVRWFWRAATRAPKLGFTGSTSTTRTLTGLIQSGDEHGSIRRLLDAVQLDEQDLDIDYRSFRTNQAASKVILCAMWAQNPRSLHTGEALTTDDLNDSLAEDDTPKNVVAEVVPRSDLSAEMRLSTGNRYISKSDDDSFSDWLAKDVRAHSDEVLESHFFNPSLTASLPSTLDGLVLDRENRIAAAVASFIELHTGTGQDDTPALASLNLDSEFG